MSPRAWVSAFVAAVVTWSFLAACLWLGLHGPRWAVRSRLAVAQSPAGGCLPVAP